MYSILSSSSEMNMTESQLPEVHNLEREHRQKKQLGDNNVVRTMVRCCGKEEALNSSSVGCSLLKGILELTRSNMFQTGKAFKGR